MVAGVACWAEMVDTCQYLCEEHSDHLTGAIIIAGPLVLLTALLGIVFANSHRGLLSLVSGLCAVLSVICLFFLLQVSSYWAEIAIFGESLQYKDFTENASLLRELVGVTGAYVCMELFLNVNEMSLNNIYKHKLGKAYLIQLRETMEPLDQSIRQLSDDIPIPTQSSWAIGPTEMRLSELNQHTKHAPFYIINAAVDLQTKGSDGSLIDRTADFFTFTKLFVGSRRLGYVGTQAMEEAQPDLDLATATSISGAALGQALIGTRQALLEFLMALLNVRMGYWCINPRFVRQAQRNKSASCWQRFRMLIARNYCGPALSIRELL
eukprot:TRINITY_DN32868_c0_g1_i1.p1 TRINITY_DN32868_c0_g1~~TRINITY_DN32868_c0_g1_i1.p1  ORF type:complete len:323 (+),score=69.32 TRINITY_DN32868_c0_g1_i1:1021-1989(+)